MKHGPMPGGANDPIVSPPRRNPSDRLVRRLRVMFQARSHVLFAAALIVSRAAGLITVPIYARLLGVDDFGRFELLVALLALLYSLCMLGMDFAISVRFFGTDAASQRTDLASGVVIAGAAAVATTIGLLLFAIPMAPILLQSPDAAVPYAIAVAAVPFNVAAGVMAMNLRLTFRARAFFKAMVGGVAVGVATGVLLVVGSQAGLVGAVIGLTATHVFTFVFVALALRGTFEVSDADRATGSQLVRIGIPMVPAAAASWAFALADRFFIAAFVGYAELGLYAAAARIASVLLIVQFGFFAAWGPVALRWGQLTDRDDRYAASLFLVANAGGAAVVAISWLARPLLEILAGPEYTSAADVVWILAAAVMFGAMFFVVQIGASLARRGDRVALATGAAAVINTIANVILIPRFGYLGAGIATLSAYLVAYAMMYTMSQRVRRLELRASRSTAVATLWTVLAAAGSLLHWSDDPRLTFVVLLASAIAAGAVAIWAAGPMGAPDPVIALETNRPPLGGDAT